MLSALTNGTAVDIVSLDQIWLGEFAQKGLLTLLQIIQKNGDSFLIGISQIGTA